MRRLIFALTFVAMPLAAAMVASAPEHRSLGGGGQSRTTAEIKGVEIDALDRKADPCVDFYQFACGGWVAKNPLPADRRSYGRFAEVQDRNFTILRSILEGPRRDGDEAKASDYYAACMDESTIEADRRQRSIRDRLGRLRILDDRRRLRVGRGAIRLIRFWSGRGAG